MPLLKFQKQWYNFCIAYVSACKLWWNPQLLSYQLSSEWGLLHVSLRSLKTFNIDVFIISWLTIIFCPLFWSLSWCTLVRLAAVFENKWNLNRVHSDRSEAEGPRPAAGSTGGRLRLLTSAIRPTVGAVNAPVCLRHIACPLQELDSTLQLRCVI